MERKEMNGKFFKPAFIWMNQSGNLLKISSQFPSVLSHRSVRPDKPPYWISPLAFFSVHRRKCPTQTNLVSKFLS